MTTPSSGAFTLQGRHVLVAFVAFFSLIVGLDIGFAVMAYRSAPGETAANPYEAGLAYQQELELKAREAALGWTASLARTADGELELAVTDRAGAPLSGLQVTGWMRRPATERDRQPLTFEPTAPGQYRSRPAQTPQGAWDLSLVARDNEAKSFHIERRLTW